MDNPNLEYLNSKVAQYGYTDMWLFKGMFIGALSRDVDEKLWRDRVDFVDRLMKQERRRNENS